MSEYPIIFTAESINAIREGRKRQTRRVIKFPKHAYTPDTSWIASVNPDGQDGWVAWGPHPVTDEQSRKRYPNGGGFRCPYGKGGDFLWVKETFYIQPWLGLPLTERQPIEYAADGHEECLEDYKKASPLFMPRWASRLTLGVEAIRAERLQEIGFQDAEDEGMDSYDPIWMYQCLWDEVNARRGYPWESNPWVWVITFRPVPEGG